MGLSKLTPDRMFNFNDLISTVARRTEARLCCVSIFHWYSFDIAVNVLLHVHIFENLSKQESQNIKF